jgi:hypothetical protein
MAATNLPLTHGFKVGLTQNHGVPNVRCAETDTLMFVNARLLCATQKIARPIGRGVEISRLPVAGWNGSSCLAWLLRCHHMDLAIVVILKIAEYSNVVVINRPGGCAGRDD